MNPQIIAAWMRRQKEAAVVRLPSHINALSASNAWSFNRPDDRRCVRVEMWFYQSKQPELAFRIPG
jgi:hypothetical protein